MSKLLGTLSSLFILYAATMTSIGTNTIVYLVIFAPFALMLLYSLWFTKPWYEKTKKQLQTNFMTLLTYAVNVAIDESISELYIKDK